MVSAAITSATYTAASTTGNSLEDMSSGTQTILGAQAVDARSANWPIGFDFWLDGIRYTHFSATDNGLVRLGAGGTTSGTNATSANWLIAGTGYLAPYYDDAAVAVNGKVHFKTIGSAPNRKLVVEWSNTVIPTSTANAGNTLYQMWLNESTGEVDYVYSTIPAAGTATIGISSNGGTNFLNVTTVSPIATTSVVASINSTIGTITSGTKISFTPGQVGSSDINSVVVTGTGTVAAPTLTVAWNNANVSTKQTGAVVYVSRDGGTTYDLAAVRTTAPASDSVVLSGLGNASTYHVKVSAISEGSENVQTAATGTTLAGTSAAAISVGAGGDFATITAALTSIGTNGLAGPTTINIRDDYAPGGETFPLTFPSVAGKDARLTIKPDDAGVAASFTLTSAVAAGSALFQFDGDSFITINGQRTGDAAGTRRFILENTTDSTTVGTATVKMQNESSYNSLLNLEIKGSAEFNSSTNTNGVVLITTSAAPVFGCDNITIDGCDIHHSGATTAALPSVLICNNAVNALLTQDQSLTRFNGRSTFNNNLLHDFFVLTANQTMAVRLGSGSTDSTISNNRIYQSAAPAKDFTLASTMHGIRVDGDAAGVTGFSPDNTQITNNRIGWATSANTPTGTFQIGPTTRAVDSRFMALSFGFSFTSNGRLSASGNSVGGIDLYCSNATAQPILISSLGGYVNLSNNTVGVNPGDSSNAPVNLFVPGSSPFQRCAWFQGTGTVVSATGNTIKNVNYSSNGAAFGPDLYAANVSAASANVTITGNTIDAVNVVNTSGSSTGFIRYWMLYFSGGTTSGTVANNVLSNSSLGTANNNASTEMKGINSTGGTFSIAGNTIRDLSVSSANVGVNANSTMVGINQSGTTAPYSITGNDIYNLSAALNPATTVGQVTAIAAAGSNTPASAIRVDSNFVHSLNTNSTGAGSTMAGVHVVSGLMTVSNNIVRLGSDASGASIAEGNKSFVGIRNAIAAAGAVSTVVHNTVHITGSGVGAGTADSMAFQRTANTAADVVANNLFSNARSNGAGTGRHFIMNLNATTGLTAANVNNNIGYLTGTGGLYGIVGAATSAAQSNWVTNTSLDTSSSALNPQYNGPDGVLAARATASGLHINPALGTPVEQGGLGTQTVTSDFDGDTRASFSPVDIGADAGNFILQDLTGPSFAYTPFGGTQSTANRSLSVTITDTSGVDVSVAGGPRFYYRNNTTNTPAGTYFVEAATTATPTFTVDYANIGGAPAIGDVIQYYLAAQDLSVPTASTSPAGGSGVTPPGSTPPGAPASYTIVQPALAGDYNVGAGETYSTLTAAAADFNLRGVSAPVRFLLTTNFTGAGETLPIIFGVPSVGPAPTAVNEVEIKPGPSATPTISGSSSGNAVVIVRASNISIDGSNTNGGTTRDLTIANTNVTNGFGVALFSNGGTLDNTGVSNTTIRCGVNTGASGATCVILTSDNLGAAGILTNTTVSNCSMSLARQAIFSNFAVGSTNLTVSDNTCTATGANALGDQGFVIQGSLNGALVRENEVANIDGTSGTNDRGIWVTAGVSNAIVERNNVHDINNTNAGGWGAWGISASTGTGSVTIRNNTVSKINALGFSLTGGTNFAESDNAIGIALWGSTTGVRLYNNSINLSGNTQTAGASLAICVTTGSSVDARNNSVMNSAGTASGTSGAYGIWMTSGTGQLNSASDNNNYFTNATVTGVQAVGRVGATDCPALGTYQTAVTGKEVGSISANPMYTSLTDLHLNCQSPNVGAGLVIATVTDDMDGDSRPTADFPDIGADENSSRGTPAAQATGFASTVVSCEEIDVAYSNPSNVPDGYLVVRNLGSAEATLPTNFTTYVQGAAYGTGSVAYVGSAVSFTDSALSPADGNWFYTTYSYNGSGGCERYRTASPLQGSAQAATQEPTAQPASLTVGNASSSSLDVSFPDASPAADMYIVLRKAGSAVAPDVPVDGVTYSFGNTIGGSTVVSVAAGPGGSFTDSGLSPNTTYHYAVFSIGAPGTCNENYLTTGASVGSATTLIAGVNDWAILENE